MKIRTLFLGLSLFLFGAMVVPAQAQKGKVTKPSSVRKPAQKPGSRSNASSAARTPKAIVDRLVANMVFVEGGTFTMGGNPDVDSWAQYKEMPAHKVTLNDFYIGKYEVTQAEWVAVMGENPSLHKGNNFPVECVSVANCQKFIDKLNEMTGKKFRLPTEAEWEYAARGGNKSKGYIYSGSNNIAEVAWCGDKLNHSATHQVGKKRPNELGLYDMSGNVFEWCQDGLLRQYSSSSVTNPVSSPCGDWHVIRGGCWYDGGEKCRVSYREEDRFERDINGFRLVMEK